LDDADPDHARDGRPAEGQAEIRAIVSGAVNDGKVSLIAGVTRISRPGQGRELVNYVAQQVGGKGRRPARQWRQAGGNQPAGLARALQIGEIVGGATRMRKLIAARRSRCRCRQCASRLDEYDSANTLKLTGQDWESGYEHPHATCGSRRLPTWNVVLAPPLRMERPRPGESAAQAARVRASRAMPTATSPRDARRAHHLEGKTFELR